MLPPASRYATCRATNSPPCASSILRCGPKRHPVMLAVYGTFDSAALKAHLEQRVGRDFEILNGAQLCQLYAAHV